MRRHKSNEDEPSGIMTSFLSVRADLKNYLMRFFVRRQDVENIVQETFLRAYESERQQQIDFPKSFLFKVAKNIALSEIEKRASRMTSYVSDVQDLNIPGRQCVEDDVDVQQKLTVLLKIVSALPPQCQRVVIMKKVLGFSHREIGRRLDISVRTVEKHLAKALQRCQESPQADQIVPAQEVEEQQLSGKMLAVRGRRE